MAIVDSASFPPGRLQISLDYFRRRTYWFQQSAQLGRSKGWQLGVGSFRCAVRLSSRHTPKRNLAPMATLTPAGASAASEAVLSDPVNPSPSAPALDASALAADPSPPVVVLADASTPNGLSTTITKAALNRTIAARKPRTTDEELGALYAEKAKLNEELQKAENKIAPPDEETQPVEGWPHWRNEVR